MILTFLCRLADESPADESPADAVPVAVDAVPASCDRVASRLSGAYSARAAERFAASYDQRAVEYPLCREVVVRHPGGREELFEVELVAYPEYHAKLKRGK